MYARFDGAIAHARILGCQGAVVGVEVGIRGVETIVDGAHAPGFTSLDIDSIGAAWYTANCHKWLCAPKGAALLHVREDLQDGFRPLVLSNHPSLPT